MAEQDVLGSAAEALAEELDIPESPFAGEEEEVEEPEESAEEATDEEEAEEGDESDEEESDEDEDESEADDEDDAKTVPLAALHAERAKRKELKEQVEQLNAQLQEVQGRDSAAEKALEDVIKQLEELDLLDLVEVKKPEKESEEVRQLRLEKEQRAAQEQFIQVQQDIVKTVGEYLPEYKNLDKTDQEQGEALMQMIVADLLTSGSDIEEAVSRSMKRMDAMVGKAKKAASRKTVKPGRTITRASSKGSKPKRARSADDVFKDMASSFMQN